jgi:small neutral amino acid transporter SnatA (MarC family)
VIADPTLGSRAAMPTRSGPDAADRLRAANRRTAFTLLAIAVVFFAGIIATKFLGGPATGIGVVGTAVLLYLVVAIGRNLRDKR